MARWQVVARRYLPPSRAYLLSFFFCLSVALVAVPTAAKDAGAQASAGSKQRTSESGLDAGCDGGGTDAATTSDAAQAALDAGDGAVVEVEQLRESIAALDQAVQGFLPESVRLSDLCQVDLSDDKAVARALEQYRERLAELSSQNDAGADAAVSSDASQDAEGCNPTDAGKGTDSAGPDAGLEVDGGIGDASSTSSPEKERTELLRQLYRAKINLLSLDREARLKLVQQDAANEVQRKLAAKAAAEHKKAEEEKQRAEQARRAALEEALKARTLVARTFAKEQARIEEIRAAQASYRQMLAEKTKRWSMRVSHREAGIARLLDDLSHVKPYSSEATELIWLVAKYLDDSRTTVELLLQAYRSTPTCRRYVPSEEIEQLWNKLSDDERKELETARSESKHKAAELESRWKQAAWNLLNQAVTQKKALSHAWIELLDKVPEQERKELLGLGPNGRRQLRRELKGVRIEAQWYRVYAAIRLQQLRASAHEPWWIANAVWRLFSLVLLVLVLRYTYRRGLKGIEAARVLLVRRIKRRFWLGVVEQLAVTLHEWLDEVLILVGVLLARTLLGRVARVPEIDILLDLALVYAVYRLIVAVGHRLFIWVGAGGRGRKSLSPEKNLRIRKAVRTVVRYVFLVALLLTIASATLGKGYLYHLIYRLAWIGGVVVFFVLIQSWRKDIIHAYLDRHPTGTLAGVVKFAQDRWYGFLVALAAFVFVLAQGLQRTAKRFVLGFEHTRKALAFLFRRRLERQATVASSQASELPPILAERLSESPRPDAPWTVDVFPAMDELASSFEKWSETGYPGSVLVVGGPGYGKTSWLHKAAETCRDIDKHIVSLDRRLLEPSAFIGFLARALDLEIAQPSEQALISALQRAPRSVVLLDDVHMLVLRGTDTEGAWNTLLRVVQATHGHVMWIATIDVYAWQYVGWKSHGMAGFDRVFTLRPWTEQQVDMLLTARMRDTGIEIVYDDLVVEHLEGVEREAQLVSTRQEYVRLLWDYSDGCPRVALACWRASLCAQDESTVRVRLFRRPDIEVLEALGEAEMFVLASVAWHHRLSAADAARSLRFPVLSCVEVLRRFEAQGIVRRRGDLFEVTTAMSRAVIRYLQRKHLIEE